MGADPLTQIHLGISTCPNDTFAFHGLIERKVDWRGLDFRVELQDVQELNRRLFAGEFDVAKASFHAAFLLAGDVGVLSSGSALGYGVGPLLLAARPDSHPRDLIAVDTNDSHPARVLCPGEHTTATLLYRIFHAGEGHIQHVVFSDIMPALAAGTADFGVCIHEGRFTYAQHGLSLIEDLGTQWERQTATPLPLGGILARLRLGGTTLRTVQTVVRDSLEYGLGHREETLPTMRRYAQELDDKVIWSHVELYVNPWTIDLAETGRAALALLQQQARAADVLSDNGQQLSVIGG